MIRAKIVHDRLLLIYFLQSIDQIDFKNKLSRTRKDICFVYFSSILDLSEFLTFLADFVDRSLGIGYAGGTAILICLLLAHIPHFIFYDTKSIAKID